MPPFEPPRILAEAALLDVAVAETFRGETIWAAFDSAKKSANAHTATAKKLTVEARRPENAADDCLLEASVVLHQNPWGIVVSCVHDLRSFLVVPRFRKGPWIFTHVFT